MKTLFTSFRRHHTWPAFTKSWRCFSILLFLTLCSAFTLNAQNVLWDKTLGGTGSDEFRSVVQTRDGGYILGGTITSDKGNDITQASRDTSELPDYRGDYWIVKLKPDGTKAWDKVLGGGARENLITVQQTRDGGYIVGGSSGSGLGGDKTAPCKDPETVAPFYRSDFWIVKLNPDGTKAWDKTLGGTTTDRLVSLYQTSDGGYILGSSTNSNYNALKLDANGNVQWNKAFSSEGIDNLYSVQQTQDGGYIFHGATTYGIGRDKTEAARGKTDFWIVKTDANGNKIWDKTLGGSSYDRLESNYNFIYGVSGMNLLKPTADGGYILGGTSNSGVGGDKTSGNRGPQYTTDFWVIKLAANGTKVWDTTVGGSDSDQLLTLQQTRDGSYILGGISYSGKSGEKSSDNFTSVYGDYWVVKLNSAGKFYSDRTVRGSNTDLLTSIDETADGNLILGGTSISNKGGDKSHNSYRGTDYPESEFGTYDFWIVKLENDFRLNQNVTFEPILNKEVGDPAFALTAKATSGLPVIYEVLSGPASINGNKLTVTGAGKVRVAAIQVGNEEYRRAEAYQTFAVTLTGKQQQLSYGGSKADALTAMVATPDGGYLLAGTSQSNASGDKSQASKGGSDYWVIKVDAAGKKIWDKTFGGANAENLTTLLAAPDGGYLLGGSSASSISGDKSQPGKGDFDYWVVKITAEGNKIWDKTFGGTNADTLTAIISTPDGGYLLGGSSLSTKGGDKSQPSLDTNEEVYTRGDYWVIKINSTGQKLWDKTYGGSSHEDLATIILRPGGGYILGGSSSSGVSGDKTQATRAFTDYWVIRIDEQGRKVWDKTYGGIIGLGTGDVYFETGHSRLHAIAATPDGGYIVAGSSSAFKGGEKTEQSPVVYDEVYDYWLIKIDDNGNKIWDNAYGGIGGYPESDFDLWRQTGNSQLSALISLPGGGYLLGGTSNADAGSDKSEDNRSPIDEANSPRKEELSVWNDYWIVKIDEQGNVVEDRTIGGERNDMLAAIIQNKEGNFLLGGTSYSGVGADKSTTLIGEADYWLVQVEENKKAEPLSSAWDNRFGTNRTDNLTDVIKTADGGYLAGGYSASGNSGDRTQNSQGKNDYWIVKTDRNGKKLWDKVYGGDGDDYLNRVIQTKDGGYLLAGSSISGKYGDKTEASQGNRDYWVVKVDATGNKQWDKRFGGSGYDELKKVVQLSTGEYVLSGYSNSPQSGDKSQGSQGGNDYWLVKISSSGAKIWDKRYGGSGNETLGSFTITNDGGFLLGGTSLSGKSGDKSQASQGNSDYWVVRTDKNGNVLWDKTFGGSGPDEAYSIGRSGNDFFISGTSSSGKSGDKSQVSQGGKDFWMVKFDLVGNKIWDKTFGGSKDDELQASTFTREGNYILAGSSNSEISGDKSQVSQGGSDYWVVAVDEDGNKVYDQRFGGSGAEELRSIFQTADGGLLLGGRSDSNLSGEHSQTGRGGNDYWLVKVAPDNTPMIAAREAAPLEASLALTHSLNAYPNPLQEKATISFTLPETQQASVKVYDSQGNEVATLFNGEVKAKKVYEVEWKAGNKPTGLYFLQLQTPTKKHQQKLLLTR